jgi:hypothetical protein
VAREDPSLKTEDFPDQKRAPSTPNSSIYNRNPFSQAGRRRFDPGLPLHIFNNLHTLAAPDEPTFRGNEVAGNPEAIDK